MGILILLLLLIIIILQVLILLKGSKKTVENIKDDSNILNDEFQTKVLDSMKNQLEKNNLNLQKEIIKEVNQQYRTIQETTNKVQNSNMELLLKSVTEMQNSVQNSLNDNQERLNKSLALGMDKIEFKTESSLSEIRKDVNQKLDSSLNDRLDSSFSKVGERLESLYLSLGELKGLESGVTSLNKTLSNVKQRGIFGEIQLGNILANLLSPNQYDSNVSVKRGSSNFVEYAVKIPDKENKNEFIYLPIDSKFPADLYNNLLEAIEKAEVTDIKNCTENLKRKIISDAMDIRDKYINPPKTTDFAIMFLPTEGLYSEVLRIPGLVEDCQSKYKVIIVGPINLTAVLNSLSVGFKYLTVNKKSNDIVKALGAFKTQFNQYMELTEKALKKNSELEASITKLQDRNTQILKKLNKIDELEYEEALKEITGSDEIDPILIEEMK